TSIVEIVNEGQHRKRDTPLEPARPHQGSYTVSQKIKRKQAPPAIRQISQNASQKNEPESQVADPVNEEKFGSTQAGIRDLTEQRPHELMHRMENIVNLVRNYRRQSYIAIGLSRPARMTGIENHR